MNIQNLLKLSHETVISNIENETNLNSFDCIIEVTK
jgi:hypothetical protein